MPRLTIKGLQKVIQGKDLQLEELQQQVTQLKLQNDLLKQYSSGGILAAMNCTVQRLAETTCKLAEALPRRNY